MANVAYLTVKKENDKLCIVDEAGNYFAVPDDAASFERIEKIAGSESKCLRIYQLKDGALAYFPNLKSKVEEMSIVTKENFPNLWETLVEKGSGAQTPEEEKPVDPLQEFKKKLDKAVKDKPSRLKLSDLKWRYVCRCALKGKNIMMTGEKGSGKTLTAYCLARVFPDQKFFKFNLGATQDPRGELIGNTHYDPKEGTVFKKSRFIEAITTPGANILLDELSRAHPDAWNILMTVLDPDQRYLLLSEDPDSPIINVAPGVTFIATANKGIKYTSTRAIDAALEDRFIFIEYDLMEKNDMLSLLTELYPTVNKMYANSIAGIYDTIRKEYEDEDGRIQNHLSTRQCIEGMDLIESGFTMLEVAETAIYPFFDKDGGADSERTFVQQTVQKYIPKDTEKSEEEFDSNWNFEDLSDEKPF